jgi:energy-coupling factor transport system ATP-binding protein
MDSISISGFYWRYPNFTGIKSDYALKGINLEVKEGEFLGITGPSGSGKTTLCYAIAGLIPHQLKLPPNFQDGIRGEISVLGKTVTKADIINGELKLSGTGSTAPEVGLVMQDPESQFLSMSVMNEVSLGLQLMGLEKKEMRSRIKDALELVGLGELYDYAEKIHPSELSGGQKQRLVIASFLAMRPKVLILDEPTSDLDPKGKMEVIETIARIKKESGMTIILVEHNPDVMLRFADRLALLYEGSIVKTGRPAEIYSDKELISKYNIYAPEVSELSDYFSVDETPKRGIPKTEFKIERKKPTASNPIIRLNGISFSYDDGTKALDNINLEIEKGSLVALVGQNGSGKSTLSKIISGILAPGSGTAEVTGLNPRSKRDRLKLPLHVSYVFQNPDHQIFTRSVTSEVNYSLKNAGITGKEADEKIAGILKRVGLSDKANEDPVFLGRGQKRRLAVASSIVIKPEVLIVDEPTTGQDYKMAMGIMEIIKSLNEEGVTVLLITHDMRLVAEYCRRAIVMSKGSIIFDGTPEALFMDENVLRLSSLSEPQSVRLSKGMMDAGLLDEPLISAGEWLNFFNFLKSKTKIVFKSFADIYSSAEKMAAELKSAGVPKGMIYVERGGMVLASALYPKLGNIKTYGISASHYNDIGASTKDVFVRGIESLKIPSGEGYVLVVDELVDTGKTLASIMGQLRSAFPTERFVTCTMLTKPRSIIKPDIYAEEVSDDTWVVFDYERNEALSEFEKANPAMLPELRKHFASYSGYEYSSIYKKIDEFCLNIGRKPMAIAYENPLALVQARLLSDRLGVKRLIPIDGNAAGIVKPQTEDMIVVGSTKAAVERISAAMGLKKPLAFMAKA